MSRKCADSPFAGAAAIAAWIAFTGFVGLIGPTATKNVVFDTPGEDE
jgi:hypothetical protein